MGRGTEPDAHPWCVCLNGVWVPCGAQKTTLPLLAIEQCCVGGKHASLFSLVIFPFLGQGLTISGGRQLWGDPLLFILLVARRECSGETDREGWTRCRRDGEPPGARCGGAPTGQAAGRACQDACALTAPSRSVSDPPPWSTLRLPGSVLRRPAGSGGVPGGLGGNLHSLPFFQVWVGSSSGLPPLESLPSDLPSWDFAQPALWRSSHSVPDTAFSLSLKKSFPALENLGPAPSSNALFCPAPPGYLRQGWTATEGGRAFTQWPVG